MEQNPGQVQYSETTNEVHSPDTSVPALEYNSPNGVIRSIDAAAATMGAEGSHTDTERMSWKGQE